MKVVDAIVVGGGLVGCSAALHLSTRRASVVLIERRSCGSQASGVNYGGVRQQGRHMSELPLARRSRGIWAKLSALIGDDCEFTASGHLKLARCDDDMEELVAYQQVARAHGLGLDLIGRRELADRYPWLGSGVVGGSLCAEDGHANPRLVAPAFARQARALGADIREGVEATDIAFDGTLFELRLPGETLRSRALINAAGAWGSQLSSRFGEPVPEGVMAPNMAVTEPLPYFIEPNLGVCGGDIYIRQIPRGNVIFGAGLGEAQLHDIRAVPLAETTMAGARRAISLVPRLADAHVIRTWSGIEGFMPDRLPVLSPSRTTPGLFHAFGFSGHGFQLAPAVGAVLSELVLDGATPTPIDAFDIARFPITKSRPDVEQVVTPRQLAHGAG
jgi:sarcosine oxidase, subunit beta